MGKGHYQRPSNLEISCVQVVILHSGEISKQPTTHFLAVCTKLHSCETKSRAAPCADVNPILSGMAAITLYVPSPASEIEFRVPTRVTSAVLTTIVSSVKVRINTGKEVVG